MPAGIAAGDALAFALQEGLCSRAGSEWGSVATDGDRDVRLLSYKATGAAAPGEEDPPVAVVSTVSHPCPAPPRPPRSRGGRGRAPGAHGVGTGGSLLSSTRQQLEDQPGETRGSITSIPNGPKRVKKLFLKETSRA